MITKEQWQAINKRMDVVFAYVNFRIDGYDICVEKRLVSPTRLVYLVFVNGKILTEWMNPECTKFYCLKTKRVFPERHLKALSKAGFSKKEIAEHKAKVVQFYSPYYGAFSTLKKTLIERNTELAWLPPFD